MNSQTNTNIFKKAFNVALAFLLVLFSTGPIPVGYADTGTFPGTVNENNSDKSITVTLNEPSGGSYKITLHSSLDTSQVGPEKTIDSTSGLTHTFTNLKYGAYYVEAKLDSKTFKSKTVEITPGALTLTTDGSKLRKLLVSGGELDNKSSVVLIKDEEEIQQKELDSNGEAIFEDLSAGHYKVKQLINGVKSSATGSKTITPEIPILSKKQDSGNNNNTGEIATKANRLGNTIELKKGDGTTLTYTAETNLNHSFTGLSAGTYSLTQIENNIPSISLENIVLINGKQPTIFINNKDVFPGEVEIIHPITYNPEITAKDANGEVIGTNTNGSLKIEVLRLDDGITVPSATVPNVPGKYKITITATDKNDNKSEAIQNVIIRPSTIEKTSVKITNTPSVAEGGNDFTKTGSIEVLEGVYPEATLYLYQDPGELIGEPIKQASDNTYTFKNVPVGKNYYIVQEFNNVKSISSERFDIEDKTEPTLIIKGENCSDSSIMSDKCMTITMGDKYIDPGYSKSDNITPDQSLSLEIISNLNVNIPGTYKITYILIDNANNRTEKDRTVTVRPNQLIAIGSGAAIGEISVKNIYPSTNSNTLTKLYLYKFDVSKGEYIKFASKTVGKTITTAVFNQDDDKKKLVPGLYRVSQEVNEIESIQSNSAEIIDTDVPVITLQGTDQLSFTWNKTKDPFYNASNELVIPSAKAVDYLEGDITSQIEVTITPGYEGSPFAIGDSIEITSPGTYKLRYNVTAKQNGRNAKAQEKSRYITIAPNKPSRLTGSPKDEVVPGDLVSIPEITTFATLYDPYGVEVETIAISADIKKFSSTKSGFGYTMTQTVNGIESEHSIPFDVKAHPETTINALFSSFTLKDKTGTIFTPIINQSAGTIHVTVPKDTDITKLIATFAIADESSLTNSTVKVKTITQKSGVTSQDFSTPVKYEITSTKDSKTVTKSYTVSVEKSAVTSGIWNNSFGKNVRLNTSLSSLRLTTAEKSLASSQGISYLSADQIIHMSALSVRNNEDVFLSARTVKASNVIKPGATFWSSSLSEIVEITTLNNKKFTQPLEIEQPAQKNTTTNSVLKNKVLAKIIEDNGKVYAIQMPSQTIKDKTIGLVSEPGMYALVDPIAEPAFISKGNDKYTITNSSGGTIHYTDSSKSIDFVRSSNSMVLGANMPLESPSNLESWTKYSTGTSISSENGELFALSVKDQFISPVRSVEIPAHEWDPTIPLVDSNKVWHVTFNARVDVQSLTTTPIRVTDSAGKAIAVNTVISKDGKTVDVIPVERYEKNAVYTLWVDKELKGNTVKKEYLKQAVKLTFQIK